jgi:tryptophan synthase beta chain
MVRVSYDQKPYRRIMMETYGAQVFASPTNRTHYGQSLLAENPDNPGCWGLPSGGGGSSATSGGAKKYSLGSVLNHVLTHQSVIGEEALKQMDMAGEYPDVVLGCVGGGSNFGGIAYPFLRQNLREGQRTRLVAVEPQATPSLTKGVYTFDFGDTARMAPVVKMHTLGHSFLPPPIHAGGLRYHGMSPSISPVRRVYRSGGGPPPDFGCCSSRVPGDHPRRAPTPSGRRRRRTDAGQRKARDPSPG